MTYFPPIKGKAIKKPIRSAYVPSSLDMFKEMSGVSAMVGEMIKLQEDVANTVDASLNDIDIALEDIQTTKEQVIFDVDSKIEEVDVMINDFNEKATPILEELSQRQGIQGEKGLDADEQKVIDSVLEKINKQEIVSELTSLLPKPIDENKLIAKVIKHLPENKASLKIIQDKIEIDYDKILETITPKLKLEVKNIDGLDKTLKLLDKRYIHGGGDTVTAGTNITITRNNNGDKVINSTGSGGISVETPSGIIDGVNVTFTVLNIPKWIVIDGVTYFDGQGYSLVGLTMTTDVAPQGFIRSIY